MRLNIAKVEKPMSKYRDIDRSHGRQIRRIITVFEGENIKHKNYPHIRSFIKIDRKGVRGKKSRNKLCLILIVNCYHQKYFGKKLEDIGRLM
ncbi:MAG: hypothetical protein WBA93_10030 [Microcoleaceae cyanobacterium]